MKKVILAIISLLILAVAMSYKSDIPVEELKAKYANEESRFIEIDDMQVHYRIEGNGPPLVLLHGTSASLHTWDVWVEELRSEFTIIRLDLPAFGLTGPNNAHDYSMAYYSKFLDKFLTSMGVDTCYLAGNSLGGAIAWHYTLDYPAKVAKLILIDAAGYPRLATKQPFIFKLARNDYAAAVLKKLTPRFMVANNLKAVYHEDGKITEELVDRYYELLLREGNREAFVSRSKSKSVDRSGEISSIKCPTLILWGEHDSWISVDNAYNFQKDISDVQVIVYGNAGHIPMEEIPEITAKDTRIFLNWQP